MTTMPDALPAIRAQAPTPRPNLARRAGFVRDVIHIAGRSLRQARREPETLFPPIFVPVFFFAIFIGSLESIFGQAGIDEFRAFQLPVSIVIAVTGVTRAPSVVTDIMNGYFDRLLLSPVNRLALLLGMMVADLAIVAALTVPVLIMGAIVGVEFTTGVLGMLAFIGVALAWSLAYVGILYAVALRTANPTVTAQTFLLFFPFVFLSTTIVPREEMTGWMDAVAGVNPLTYVYGALRSLITEGWSATPLLHGFIAIVAVGILAHTLAYLALRGRVSRSRR
ncbi:ABC transporter permease [Micromonospora arborensis]|uniref:ABC transporter permease n=1 Tax=Micromonospora arborensis TaxID=2116518 RepID=UPI003719A1F2